MGNAYEEYQNGEEVLSINLICLHSCRSYEEGIVVLPEQFLEQYADKLPDNVYLHVPSSIMWSGKFVKEAGTIEGLQSMISFYNLKQYNMPILEYNGVLHFNLCIFNCYAMEIEYSLGAFPSQNSVIEIEKMMNAKESVLKTSKVELEKLAIAFNFNAYNNTQNTWEVKLDKKHVETKHFHQVLSNEALKKLRIDELTSYVNIGFVSCMWKIELVKDKGYFSFGKVWNDFVNECNLSKGDVCIFQRKDTTNAVQVTIFNNKEISKWSPPNGEELAKSRTSFFHISNKESLAKGEIVLPRVFIQKYALQVRNVVKLWMADRRVWITAFCESENCIFGLQRLQNYYSIEPETVMVFNYFGNSTFYLSIFGSNGVDLLYDIKNKMTVKDIVMERNEHKFGKGDHSGAAYNIEENSGEDDSDGSGESLSAPLGEEDSENNWESFSVALSISHFDNISHGVYIPRSLKRFHNTWRNGKNIILSYEGKRWAVKGNAAGKSCRLGKGLSNFIDNNDFVVGQCLKFEYFGTADIAFKITI